VKGWWNGSSGRALAYQAQGSEFNPNTQKKKGNEDRRPLTTPVIEMEVQESNSDVNTRVIKRSRG
jgi:hypothetical protein